MRAFAVIFLALCLSHATVAHADGDSSKTIDLALENLDLGDYSAAKSQLDSVLEDASDTAVVVRANLVLGAVYVKLGNEAGARAAFSRALGADQSARPEARYADKATMELFDKVLAERVAATSCDGIAAIAHERGKPAKAGQPYRLSCHAGNQLGDVTLSVLYRTDSDAAYAKIPMNKTGECAWDAEIPPVSGDQLEYHFAAANKAGTIVAAHGSADSPISVIIEAVAEEPPKGKRTEDEVPDELGGKPPKPRGNGCAGCSGAPATAPFGPVLLVCALLVGLRRNRLSS